MQPGEKWIWLITGPNGAGKTRLHHNLPEDIRALPYLNPDFLASALAFLPQYADKPGESPLLQTPEKMARYIEVGDRFKKQIEGYLKEGKSFCLEQAIPSGVFGHSIKDLQQAGWKIGVVAVGLESAEASQTRVDQRVQKNGHTVPAAEATWEYCRERTPELLKLADHYMLYDSSDNTALLVATKKGKYASPVIHHAPPNDYTKTLLENSALRQGPDLTR